MHDTAYEPVYAEGAPVNLAVHFGRPETTLVGADRPVVQSGTPWSLLRPNLLIAFDVDPDRYHEQGGYCIVDQGKPPDFLLQVAAQNTAYLIDYMKDDYAAMGVPEYWRVDQAGEQPRDCLSGLHLAGDRYEPIPIVEVAPNTVEGRSEALNLILRWQDGELLWIDPATGQPLPGLESERAARLEAESQARQAETRVRELETELRRLRERGG